MTTLLPAPPPRDAYPVLEARDIARLLGWCALTPFAWLLPERLWPGFTGAAARLLGRLPGGLSRRLDGGLSGAGFPGGAAEVHRIAVQERALMLEQDLQYLREWRPGGPPPAPRLTGAQHLATTLAAGRGAVLWVAEQPCAGLLVKKALHAAGYRVHHLSHESHGPSNSLLGIRGLNRLVTRAEAPYVRERIVMKRQGMLGVVRRLERHLRANELVTITAALEGHRQVMAPMFGAWLPIANGAAALAVATGAALLPVFLERDAAGFRVDVEPALTAASGLRPRETADALGLAFGTRLAERARRDPARHRLWLHLEASPAGSAP